MRAYRIGVIDGPWIDFEPPISGGTFISSDQEETVHYVPGNIAGDIAVECDTSSLSASGWPKVDGITRRGAKQCLGSQSIGFLDSLPCGPTFLTNKKQWLENQSSVSDALKECTSQFNPTGFINHAVQLQVDFDLSEYPSLDPESQRNISINFRKLHQKIRESGLYVCDLSKYSSEVVRYVMLFSLFILTLRYEWYITSAVFLGLFWHQIMFVAHDAGHLAITHNFELDTIIGILVADFCCGLSIGWWKSSHNVHHLVPNHPVCLEPSTICMLLRRSTHKQIQEHDPDIQNVPIFATSSSFFNSLCSSYYGSIFFWDAAANLLVPLQKYTYYPVMCVARFNLYFLSWCYLISDKAARLPSSTWTRPLEILCMLCYWYLFGYCLVWLSIPTWPLRIAFVLVSHITTMPLHVQITLSHWGMSTTDLGASESFAQKQLRTTMDVDCPAWLDFIHGGLQFQSVHHLFPRMPRHNLRAAQKLVREFCKEIGIKYTIFGFVDGNEVVLGRLGEISKQLELLAKCQKHLVAEV